MMSIILRYRLLAVSNFSMRVLVSESSKFAEVEEMSFIEFLKTTPIPPPILLERGICVNVKLCGIRVAIGELIC